MKKIVCSLACVLALYATNELQIADEYNKKYENLLEQGEYNSALNVCDKDLAIKEKVLGKEHAKTATSYNNIDLTYYYLGDYEKALEFFIKPWL